MDPILSDLATWVGGVLAGFPLVSTLMILMAIDIVTGVSVAVVRRELNSSTSAVGMAQKVVTLCLVGVAITIGKHMPGEVPLAGVCCLFFCGTEGLSILENAGRLGVKLPAILRQSLEKLSQEPSSRRAAASSAPKKAASDE